MMKVGLSLMNIWRKGAMWKGKILDEFLHIYFPSLEKLILDSPSVVVIFTTGEKSTHTKPSITTTFTSKDGSFTSRLSIDYFLVSSILDLEIKFLTISLLSGIIISAKLYNTCNARLKLSDFWQMQRNFVPALQYSATASWYRTQTWHTRWR